MTRSIITAALLTFSITSFAQEDYNGFEASDGAALYSTVIDVEKMDAGTIITELTSTLNNNDEVADLVAEGESITYTLTWRAIDVHGLGLKNASMKSDYLQDYSADVSIEAREGRYKVIVSNIVFEKEDPKKNEEPVRTFEEMVLEDGEMKRLGVADKYALDALAADITAFNTIAEAEDEEDDW